MAEMEFGVCLLYILEIGFKKRKKNENRKKKITKIEQCGSK
ncbi:MAG: hypothetical protein V8Q12_02655 [Agathobacter rectalis]